MKKRHDEPERSAGGGAALASEAEQALLEAGLSDEEIGELADRYIAEGHIGNASEFVIWAQQNLSRPRIR